MLPVTASRRSLNAAINLKPGFAEDALIYVNDVLRNQPPFSLVQSEHDGLQRTSRSRRSYFVSLTSFDVARSALMVMRHRLRRCRHWNPIQQAASPCFRGRQLPVVAIISNDAGKNDRSWTSERRPPPRGWRSICRRRRRTGYYGRGGKCRISG